MSDYPLGQPDARHHALLQGRAEGMATAALAAGCIAFVNLLGAEKALLSLTLAAFALPYLHGSVRRGQAFAAVALSLVYIVTVTVVLVLYHEQLGHLVHLLKTLA